MRAEGATRRCYILPSTIRANHERNQGPATPQTAILERALDRLSKGREAFTVRYAAL